MGYSLNHIAGLGLPFQVVHEQIVDVAPGGTHTVRNDVRKLLFILSGECRHQVVGWDGPWADVLLRPGDILALPHRCQQRYSPVERGTACRLHVVRLSFDPQQLPVLSRDGHPPLPPLPDSDADALAWARFAMREIRCLRASPGTVNTIINETLLHLRNEAETRAPGYRPRVHGLCVGLTILFARAGAGSAGSGDSHSEQAGGTGYHVGKIKRYLQGRFHQPTRLADVAESVSLSEEHVARLFKTATGVTLFEYVRRLRIAEAKSLLAATDENLSEIARRTGFSSLTVFSRNFRREAGLTPSEYRRQIARQIG
jgi:AraC-like DNA-binding protein